MISEAFNQFRKDIIENLSFSGVLFWFIFLPIILILLSLAYEDLTNSLFLSKIERKTALLKLLHEMEREGITQSENLNSIYSKAVTEINSYDVARPRLFQFLTHRLAIAFAAGMPLGLLISLAFIFNRSTRDRSGSRMVSVFGLGIALVGGAVSLIITVLSNLLTGFIIIVILQATFILYVVGSVFRQAWQSLKTKKEKERGSTVTNKKK